MEMNVEKTRVMRLSRHPAPVQIMVEQKQLEKVKYFSYLGSMITDVARCANEVKSRIDEFSIKSNLTQNVCFDFLYNFFSEIFHILRRTQRATIINVHRVFTNSRYSRDALIKLEFSNRFSRNTQISNLLKIPPVGAELFHVDRRTDVRT
jgi:hypothetical protein